MSDSSITLVSTTDSPEEVQAALAEYGYQTDTVETIVSGSAGKAPESGETEKPAPEAAPSDDSAATDKTAPESDPEKSEQVRDENGRFVSPNVQKRIDKAIAKQREAERKAAELEAELAKLRGTDPAAQAETTEPAAPESAATPAKPKVEDFETYEEFTEALAEWKAEQKITAKLAEIEQNKQTQARQEAWGRQLDDARTRYQDYDQVVGNDDIQITEYMQAVILESEVGADVCYYLGQHPEEAERIAALPPLGQARAIGHLETKFTREAAKPAARSAAPQPQPRAGSRAPAPIRPVSASASAEKDPEKMTPVEWRAWRAAGGGR
ncbi:MAG TPA: hypothetical protein VFA33_07525 [Bryobacteraceae bacterium]|nr:hypothetical protein [Bryobacteraceae bacterium]